MYPNIVFILIDGLRSDRCYGNDRSCKTPNIDSLIKNGIYFDQAISSADGTFLSINSTFNSLFPFVTGVRAKKIVLTKDSYLDIIKNTGYHIYGIIPKFTSLNPIIKLCENENPTFAPEPPNAEYLSDGLGKKIIDLLKSKKTQEPWFTLIHINDLHWPLTVPEKTNSDRYGNTNYDRSVSAIDPWIGKFLDQIDLNKTLVILTSDHGNLIPVDEKGIDVFEPEFQRELNLGKKLLPKFSHNIGKKPIISLKKFVRDVRLNKANRNLTSYEKRSRLPYFTMSLYDEIIKIPLVFAGHGVKKPQLISKMVRAVDIFPTISSIIKLPKMIMSVHGKSLIPLFENKEYVEYGAYLHTIPYEKPSESDKVGLRTSKFKYFRHSRDSTKDIHLFDLENDPFENNNIAQNNPSIVNDMEKKISDIINNTTPVEIKEEVSEEDTKRIEKELKKMGYL